MPITQVYDVFRDSIDEDSTLLWFHVKTPDNRSVYFHIDYEKRPVFSSLLPMMDWGPSRAEHLCNEAAKLIKNIPGVLPDYSALPQIEDSSPAMQEVFSQLDASDSMMSFVDFEDHLWEDLNLTQEEFENQMDADIDKYGLSDVIVKGEDESLYTCYADLLTRFSMPVQQERVQEKERDDGMSGRNGDKIEFSGLVLALHYYNEDGKIGKCGSWEIHDGGYDRWWELCYNGEPIISCNASGEYLNGKELGNLERERRIPDETFSKICKIIKDNFPECRMSPEEAKRTRKQMLLGAVHLPLEPIKNQAIGMNNFVTREQLKRLNSMSEINDMQEHGNMYLSDGVMEFAKSFTPEQLEDFRRLLTPTGAKAEDTQKLLEMATRHAVHKLVIGEGVSQKEVVKTLIKYSPMAELADPRIPFNERTKTAMGIILEAQRFNEKINGLEVGKEAETSL